MQREAVYEAWVPEKSAWSLWARPVLFGHMSRTSGTDSADPTPIQWAWDLFGSAADTPAAEPEQPWRNIAVDWAPPPSDNAVLVVDLPGEAGVHFGLALAGHGYRPVPLYNGCPGPSELIDHGPIVRALRAGTAYLAALSLPADAPPVFLLDWRRASLPRPLRTGMLDNRWKVLLEDLPSKELLRRRGISRVLLVQRDQVTAQDDVARILRFWQEGQIPLEAKYLTVAGPPRRLMVPPIPWYRRIWYTVLSTRGPRDGFGYIVRTQG